MPVTILSGKIARDALTEGLVNKVRNLSHKPNLAIIQVGNREDSTSYIRAKKNFAERIGVEVLHTQVSSNITQEKLIDLIKGFNNDENINGIIVQLPISEHLDKFAVTNAIDSKKDVDGLTAFQIEAWSNHKAGAILPATARGVKELLKYYDINLSGKKVVIIGRSDMVGRPLAVMCNNSGAIVAICHSKTVDLAKETKKADIIIVAVGKPKLIDAEHVKAGQIIIDVGLNTVYGEKLEDEIENKKLVGDVDFEGVKEIVFAITPVPGGVGPMTVFALFENLIDVSSVG